MTTSYHRRFRNLDTIAVAATGELLGTRPSTLTTEQAMGQFSHWLAIAAAIYRMPVPALRIVPGARCTGYGTYLPAGQGTIEIPKIRVTGLLHLFRHHMQSYGATVIGTRGDPADPTGETDARAWALSMYHTAAPDLFARMVTQGRILHMTAADLAPAGPPPA